VVVQNPRSKAPAIDRITAEKAQNVVSKVSTLTPPKAIVTNQIINTRGIRKDLLRVAAIPQKHRLFGETLKMVAKTQEKQNKLLAIKAVSE
jgi:hypothetical protein